LALPSFAWQDTFTNPLLPSGADPWSIHKDGWYYYTHTTGRNITLFKSKSIAELASAERKVVWTPPPDQPYSKNLWAPELHFIRGKWYVYFAADDGHNRNHRLYVLENPSPDPLAGEWKLKGKLTTPEDRWSIDGTVMEHRGKLYLLWSGWEGTENGRQDLYIARLKNPWTVTGRRTLISKPELPWETIGDIPKPGPDDKPHVSVNEGPQPLVRPDRVFVVYSASGCWTDAYSLGMLSAAARADLLNPKSWTKHPQPVFQARNAPGTYGAGHNSFFKSPDGTEDWILYHANTEPGQGCGRFRSPRAQRFTWSANGLPDFGTPVPAGVPLPLPSESR
jgi:GH43 family beta-xylosidase